MKNVEMGRLGEVQEQQWTCLLGYCSFPLVCIQRERFGAKQRHGIVCTIVCAPPKKSSGAPLSMHTRELPIFHRKKIQSSRVGWLWLGCVCICAL